MRYLEILKEFMAPHEDPGENAAAAVTPAPAADTVDTKVYYHVTTKARLNSIEANGIVPNRKRRHKTGTGRLIGERGKIYLMSDFHAAVHWANKIQWERYNGKEPDPSPYVILCVRENPKNLAPDPHPDSGLYGKSWFEKSGKIDPANIMKVIPLTKDLIQSVSESAVSRPIKEDNVGAVVNHMYSLRKCLAALAAKGWQPTSTPNEFQDQRYPEFTIDLDIDSHLGGPFTVFAGTTKLGVTKNVPSAQHLALKHGVIDEPMPPQDDYDDFSKF